MIKQLTKLANHLDGKGYRKEADFLDSAIRKLSAEEDEYDELDMDDESSGGMRYQDKGMTGGGRGLSQYEMSDAGELSYPSDEEGLEGIDRTYSGEDFRSMEDILTMEDMFPSDRPLAAEDTFDLRIGTEEVPDNIMNAEDMRHFKGLINTDPVDAAIAFGKAYNLSEDEDERDSLISFLEEALVAARQQTRG